MPWIPADNRRSARRLRLLLLSLCLATIAAPAGAVTYDGPASMASIRSLRDAIVQARAAGRTLHILFVHGIRSTGGDAIPFVDRLTEELKGTSSRGDPVPIPIGPPQLQVMMAGDPEGTRTDGRSPVWRDADDWSRSQPYVVRSSIQSATGDVTVDEINYWPLLMPLKCRFILEPDHDLSGNAKTHLKFCFDHGWFTKDEYDHLIHAHPVSGGGAIVNRALKQEIMNWGLADAVIALGPMRALLHEAFEEAAANATADSPHDEYVIVSESLGSFVVLDSFADPGPGVRQLEERTADIYFFANQFALLELARIQGLKVARAPTQAWPTGSSPASAVAEAALPDLRPLVAVPPSPAQAIGSWGTSPRAEPLIVGGWGLPRQIVAFSDPDDLLTYRVPRIDQVAVINIYDHPGLDLFGLIADPVRAHTGHVKSNAVWRILMRDDLKK